MKIQLESFKWGFFIWKLYWNLPKRVKKESWGNTEEWGTLMTFFFIPVIWEYRN